MNYKIKKYCEVTLLCCLCVGFVAGSNNLKIFRNVDDRLVEVSSKIEVLNGANLTLICQIENVKNKGIINGYVTWFIPPKINSEVKLRTLKNSSNLVFRNVNTDDEALYVCASLKFKIFKTLRLLLKQSESAKPSYLNIPRLTKREIVPGNGFYVFNESDPFISDRDLDELTKSVERMREDLFKEIENEKKHKYYDEIYNNNDISFNNNKESNTHSFPVKPVALIFGVLFVVFVIFLLIRLCGYISHNSSQHTRNTHQPDLLNPGVTVPRPNRCGHISCSRNYLLNPAGACRFQNNILPTAPIIYDGMDMERPRTHDTRNPTTELDLPPTYSSSAHNSTQNLNEATVGFNKNVLHPSNNDNLNLPPSYDEAVHDSATASQNLNGNHDHGHIQGGGGVGSNN